MFLVIIKNTQRKFHLNLQQIEDDLNVLRQMLRIEHLQIDVLFCSSNKIRELNQEHRHKAKATDVLSFPMIDVSNNLIIYFLII